MLFVLIKLPIIKIDHRKTAHYATKSGAKLRYGYENCKNRQAEKGVLLIQDNTFVKIGAE